MRYLKERDCEYVEVAYWQRSLLVGWLGWLVIKEIFMSLYIFHFNDFNSVTILLIPRYEGISTEGHHAICIYSTTN
jgi:hypothetical protein